MSDEPDTVAGADPKRIRSIAVHREDVANALEATLRSDREIVLRVTPPFSGRMRARLHSFEEGSSVPAERGDTEGAATIHIDPRDLITDATAYPEVDETAVEYPDSDIETRRERHAEAVASWRTRIRESVVSSVAIEGDDGAVHEVDVTVLG